VNIEMQYNRM